MGTFLPELRANMVRLRESLWTQLQDMEADLKRVPLPQSLLKKLCESESKWHEIEQCHGTILAISEGDLVQREIIELRALYFNVNDRSKSPSMTTSPRRKHASCSGTRCSKLAH